MRYILCLLPPLAVIVSTKNPITWIVNIILTLLLYLPGVIHAILIVNKYYADQRTKKLEKAIRESGKQG